MIDKIKKWERIFQTLDETEVAYLVFENYDIKYRQKTKVVVVNDLFFDVKLSNGFLNQQGIKKNIAVLNKLKTYTNHLISVTPTKSGFYFQVFDQFGNLCYCQEINFFITNKIQTWFLKRKYPELVLKKKYF